MSTLGLDISTRAVGFALWKHSQRQIVAAGHIPLQQQFGSSEQSHYDGGSSLLYAKVEHVLHVLHEQQMIKYSEQKMYDQSVDIVVEDYLKHHAKTSTAAIFKLAEINAVLRYAIYSRTGCSARLLSARTARSMFGLKKSPNSSGKNAIKTVVLEYVKPYFVNSIVFKTKRNDACALHEDNYDMTDAALIAMAGYKLRQTLEAKAVPAVS